MSAIDIADWLSLIVGAVAEAVLTVLCFRIAWRREGGVMPFYLLVGFYACIFLCDAYYLITWTLTGYPFVFSPGDLSWVGGILFLIAAARGIIGEWTPEQRTAAEAYRLPALLAPAVCLAFNTVYIAVYPQILFNYLVYGVPTVILSYYALWLWLAAQKAGVQREMRSYHLAVLIWVAIQLCYDLFSTLGDAYLAPFLVCSWLLACASISLYFAARRGACAT